MGERRPSSATAGRDDDGGSGAGTCCAMTALSAAPDACPLACHYSCCRCWKTKETVQNRIICPPSCKVNETKIVLEGYMASVKMAIFLVYRDVVSYNFTDISEVFSLLIVLM